MKRPLVYLAVLVAGLGMLALTSCGGSEDGREESAPATTVKPLRLPADFPPYRFESLRPAPPGLFVVTFTAPRTTDPG